MKCSICRHEIEDMNIHLLVTHGIKQLSKNAKPKYSRWKEIISSPVRMMRKKCEACGKPCDGSLQTPLIESGLRLCTECFDEEIEKAEPILKGNRYYIVPEPLDAA